MSLPVGKLPSERLARLLRHCRSDARVLIGAGIGRDAAALAKIEKNARKYPVEKARGNAKKYDEL